MFQAEQSKLEIACWMGLLGNKNRSSQLEAFGRLKWREKAFWEFLRGSNEVCLVFHAFCQLAAAAAAGEKT